MLLRNNGETLIYKLIATGFVLAALFSDTSADQDEALQLQKQYRQFSAATKPIEKNIPLRIDSREQNKYLNVVVYGDINYHYTQVADILASPAAMCDFLILNLNVKACTHLQGEKTARLAIYIAGKKYTPLYRTMEINPYFEIQKRDKSYLRVLMASQKGSWGISEYSVLVEAASYGNKTLVRFTSRYRAGRINKAATVAYLKTFARNKVGFTVTSQNNLGQPEYIRGMQGVIERNAVRSYLALQAYLDTASKPQKQKFESRLRRWFELTDVYKQQLHEMSLQQYLLNKQREYKNQLRLQELVLRSATRR